MPDLKISGLTVDATPSPLDYLETLDVSDATDGPAGSSKRATLASLLTVRAVTAPADGSLAAGELAFWLDDTNGASRLVIKAKSANGTVVTGSVALS